MPRTSNATAASTMRPRKVDQGSYGRSGRKHASDRGKLRPLRKSTRGTESKPLARRTPELPTRKPTSALIIPDLSPAVPFQTGSDSSNVALGLFVQDLYAAGVIQASDWNSSLKGTANRALERWTKEVMGGYEFKRLPFPVLTWSLSLDSVAFSDPTDSEGQGGLCGFVFETNGMPYLYYGRTVAALDKVYHQAGKIILARLLSKFSLLCEYQDTVECYYRVEEWSCGLAEDEFDDDTLHEGLFERLLPKWTYDGTEFGAFHRQFDEVKAGILASVPRPKRSDTKAALLYRFLDLIDQMESASAGRFESHETKRPFNRVCDFNDVGIIPTFGLAYGINDPSTRAMDEFLDMCYNDDTSSIVLLQPFWTQGSTSPTAALKEMGETLKYAVLVDKALVLLHSEKPAPKFRPQVVIRCGS